MLIKLSPTQEAQLMAWAKQHGTAEVAANCEPSGYQLSISVSPMGMEAEAQWGSDTLQLGEVEMQLSAQPSAAGKADRFIEMLKRFNAKERNFLMRYALCGNSSPTLSPLFVNDLLERLKNIGVPKLEGVEAVYFGMDYHLEWIHASLLLANWKLALNNGRSKPQEGGQKGRIEDVDLLVVLQRPDASVVLVLIEAKGVTSFSTGQLDSKEKRLKDLRTAIGEDCAWLESVVLLMCPEVARPSPTTLEYYAGKFAHLGFWRGNDPALLWMDLKGFFADIGEPRHSLRIGMCYASGKPAANIADRKQTVYTHWRVQRRIFAGKKRT